MHKLVPLGLILFLVLNSCQMPDSENHTRSLEERVFYEIFVHAFYDSNGDGIGDLRGVTQKLDYLADLGIGGLWLLPVHPSPSYHKYDVSDYYSIHPDYGSMEDFRELLKQAHQRDMLVLIDMVINHSASDHRFFQEARKGKHNPFRDYYVWSSDTALHAENPHHWHFNGKDKEKYYGFFWKGMPDLNYDKQEVREEMKKIGRYWLEEVGVDGFRLDAIRYIYPDSLVEKNVEWWQEYRKDLDQTGLDHFMVAELWAEKDYVAPFLNRGVHAAFNFDLSFAIEEMLLSGEDPGIGRLLQEIHADYNAFSESWYDAIFIKNHDQDRIRSILGDEERSRLAASLLFTLPGIPFLYYGEEISMQGKKPDEHIREPMVWDLPGKDPGQCSWIEPRYSTPDNMVPVSLQGEDPGSMLNHYRELIALRKHYPVLALGKISPLEELPPGVCAYALRHEDRIVHIFHNLQGKTVRLKKEAGGRILYPAGAGKARGEDLLLPAYASLVLEAGKR